MGENLHENHRQRLKKRMLKQGLEGFEDHVLLELLLTFAIARKDTNETAHLLLRRFGTLRGVFEADIEQLTQVDGVGEHTAVLLKIIPELTRRYYDEDVASLRQLTNTDEMCRFVSPKFVGATQEKLLVVFLDGRNVVLGKEFVNVGSVSKVSIDVRRIAKRALELGAVAIIVAHNHPNGFATPSPEDIATTRTLCEILFPMEVKVLDHIIVAPTGCVSLFESGQMPY